MRWPWVVSLAALAVLLLAPGTPWSVGHGDVLLAAGHPRLAVTWYRWVARAALSPDLERRAWRRALIVTEVDLADPVGSAALLAEQLSTTTGRRHRARILADIADNHRRQGDLKQATATWLRAAEEAPRAASAGDWLLRRANTLADLGQGDAADSAFAQLGHAHPEHRGHAWLARARLAQARGDIHEALKHYDVALENAQQPEVAAVARLGAAACLERLGELDEALVMLDAPALPREVREVRADGLRRRSEASVP